MKAFFGLKGLFGERPMQKVCTQRELLLENILKTQNALETAYAGFDNATDPDLIDCYIYEVNSALKRYRYLQEQAKRMDLFDTMSSCEEIATMPENLSSFQNC